MQQQIGYLWSIARRLWLVLFVILTACSAIKPSPAKPSPFIEQADALKDAGDDLPFQKAWFKDVAKLREIQTSYQSVHIAPIDTSSIGTKKDSRISDAVSLGVEAKDIQKISQLLYNEIIAAIKSYDKTGTQIVDQPTPNTLVIKVALVELRPTQTAINAGQTVAGFFIPGSQLVAGAISAGASAATSPLSNGSIAMEAKFQDGPDGELLGEISDRQVDPTTVLINFRNYTKFGHARSTVRRWAKSLAEFLMTPASHPVSKPLPLTFALW